MHDGQRLSNQYSFRAAALLTARTRRPIRQVPFGHRVACGSDCGGWATTPACQAGEPSARQLAFAPDESGGVYIQGLRMVARYIHGFLMVTVYIHGLPTMVAVYIHGLLMMTVYIQGLLTIAGLPYIHGLDWAGVVYIHGRLPAVQDVVETTPE